MLHFSSLYLLYFPTPSPISLMDLYKKDEWALSGNFIAENCSVFL
jgi:hypothetical protein